jgi:hypothetical protein
MLRPTSRAPTVGFVRTVSNAYPNLVNANKTSVTSGDRRRARASDRCGVREVEKFEAGVFVEKDK